jgi:pyruvate dehydrogenase E1 component beta subunit
MSKEIDYGSAIREGFEYLLEKFDDVVVLGQGLWSPWYVGNSMTELEKKFGKNRVIDTPVSESAVTGIGVGAAIAGMRPIIVHPRMDFMLYAMDAIVNEAAKWSYMFGGQASAGVTIRSIINRGGEQGAQHSQALHAWFAHIPGLRVVMPYSVSDARDLLIASVLSKDPVIYIDDRWLYETTGTLEPIKEIKLENVKPTRLTMGTDLTIVGSGYSTYLALEAEIILRNHGINCEVIDLRVISPIDIRPIVESVMKTGRLLVVDGGWSPAGIAGEILASIVENVAPSNLRGKPRRITLPFSPAPAAPNLEHLYYPTIDDVVKTALEMKEVDD